MSNIPKYQGGEVVIAGGWGWREGEMEGGEDGEKGGWQEGEMEKGEDGGMGRCGEHGLP